MSRVFILGAGFSKAVGLPLTNELMGPACERAFGAGWESDPDNADHIEWLKSTAATAIWLGELAGGKCWRSLNIEDVVERAEEDAIACQLNFHAAPVGGPIEMAETLSTLVVELNEAIPKVILDAEQWAPLPNLERWANALVPGDTIITFNYDRLAEQLVERAGRTWSHGFALETPGDVQIFKLHGSIDWIASQQPYPQTPRRLTHLWGPRKLGCDDVWTNSKEWSLHRLDSGVLTPSLLDQMFVQLVAPATQPNKVATAALGGRKACHRVPGLGEVWRGALQRLYEADEVIGIGFSMSPADEFARRQFAKVAADRCAGGRPLKVQLIDPGKDAAKQWRTVFGKEHVKHHRIRAEQFPSSGHIPAGLKSVASLATRLIGFLQTRDAKRQGDESRAV